MRKQFPIFVFVSICGEDEEPWLECVTEAIDAIEDDGPTKVATYKLVEVNRLSKRVVSQKTPHGRARMKTPHLGDPK